MPGYLLPYGARRYVLTLVSAVLFVAYLAVLNRFYDGDGFTHLMRVAYANLMLLIMFHKAATYLFTQVSRPLHYSLGP